MKPIDLDEFRKQRIKEGHRVTYNPEVHPGIIERLAILGRTQKEIAAIIGVAQQTLSDWIQRHDECATAWNFGNDLADAEVMKAHYDLAVGWVDDQGRRKGANVTAQIFWLKNRCGWRNEQPLAKDDDRKDEDNLTPEAMAQAAKALIRILEAAGGEGPPMIDATPAPASGGPEDEFKEFDE